MKRSACIRCDSRLKLGAVRCPKCHKYVVSKVTDRFFLQQCLVRKPDRLSFLAKDTVNDCEAFVRVTLPGAPPVTGEAFEREVRLLLFFRGNPAVPEFFDGGQVPQTGGLYSALEFVHGEKLEKAFRRLALEDKIALMQKVAETVGVLHAHGCVHGALGPKNFRCDATGHVRMVDFTNVVQEGALYCGRGIPSYTPPEQYRVGTQAAFTADVFSLGASFYFLLTGKLPFGKAGIGGTKAAYRLAQPSSLNKALTPALDEVIMKTLAQNPIDRYSSAAELARALQDSFGATTVVDGLPYAFPSKARVLAGTLWAGITTPAKASWVMSCAVWRTFDRFSNKVGRLIHVNPSYVKVGAVGATAIAMVALPLLNHAWAARSKGDYGMQVAHFVMDDRTPNQEGMDGMLILADPSELAFVQFHAWPPAIVSVDGEFLVEAPSPRWFPLTPGQHDVIVAANDGKYFEIPFIATANKSQVIQCQFDERWWRIQEVVK